MVEISSIVWRASMLACFVVFIAIIVTIIDVRKRPEPVLMPSVALWVFGSVFGAILWSFITTALFGSGSRASSGLGIFGMLISLVGPILYVWTGYVLVKGSRKTDQSS